MTLLKDATVSAIALAALLALAPVATAQTAGSGLPNVDCPAPGKTETSVETGVEEPAKQPVELSAILPSVGGNEDSAAPTVQQDGKDVMALSECPQNEPGHPNSMDKPTKTN